jgi:hypothetical protein
MDKHGGGCPVKDQPVSFLAFPQSFSGLLELGNDEGLDAACGLSVNGLGRYGAFFFGFRPLFSVFDHESTPFPGIHP